MGNTTEPFPENIQNPLILNTSLVRVRTAGCKESSLPGSNSELNEITADQTLNEDDRQWAGNVRNRDDEVEMTPPSQDVHKLGGLRFRPPDDDEAQ